VVSQSSAANNAHAIIATGSDTRSMRFLQPPVGGLFIVSTGTPHSNEK
jgi:hypothetical protein